MMLYYCDLLFGHYPSSFCFATTAFHLMTREEPSLEMLRLQNKRTMDKVQITDRSSKKQTRKVFRLRQQIRLKLHA
jgi:hypothetical protein